MALQLGVTVIAAHVASDGANQGQPNFDRLLSLLARYDNLYSDISALTQANRPGALRAALNAGVTDRLVYGSDWPLQFVPLVSPLFHLRDIAPTTADGD